jgi:nucleotide-binding universal stress UspA family protein
MKRKSAKQGRRFAVKPQRLLVPIDFSTPSERALRDAEELAAQSGGSLILLHVVPADYGWLGIGREESRDLDKALQRQAAERLRALADAYVRQHLPVDVEIRIGRPAEQIIAAANESKCDAIVLSTHGLSGLDRYLIGSVADRVARLSSCPIFLIPTTKRSLPKKQKPPAVLRFKHPSKPSS